MTTRSWQWPAGGWQHKLLEAPRETVRPEEWAALSSGYRLESKRMQGEILDSLVQDVRPGSRGAAA